MKRYWILGATIALLFSPTRDETANLVIAQAIEEGCPESSSPQTQTGATLKSFAETSNSGIVYDDTGAKLQLQKEGGLFRSTSFDVTSKVVGICTGDFDEDGWVDFIGAVDGGQGVGFYKNLTYENQVLIAPDWDNPDYRTIPKFAPAYHLENNCAGANGHAAPPSNSCSFGGGITISCADYNNDGHMDFFYARSRSLNTGWVYSSWTTRADIFLGNGDGTFQPRYQAITNLGSLRYLSWSVDSTPYDYNNDGYQDLIVGHSYTNSKSDVHVYTSNGSSTQPMMTKSTRLLRVNGRRATLASHFGDMNGDGFPDLVVSGPDQQHIRIHDGIPGGGVSQVGRQITSTWRGGATNIVSADFSLDGIPDIMVASDNWNYPGSVGGYASYWKNNRSATPFSDGITQETATRNNPYYDFDVGAVIDYDNDPDGTPDVLIADGNHSAGYVVLANRTIAQYAECGEVISGVLDLQELAAQEMVITGARITPNITIPAGTSATFFLSNEIPENWVPAVACADDSNSYCSSFTKPVGRTIRWKAELCTNFYRNLTPQIIGVDIGFDYTVAEEHYRSGVVVDDGVAYVGAFRQPGERGHLYALNAGFTETYWDFAEKLNAMNDADRNIYTSTLTGDTRLDFNTNNASNPLLLEALDVPTPTQATALIAWQRSARFGVNKDSKLGGITHSTPAVVGPPGLPTWYPKSDTVTKTKVDLFIASQANRPKLVLVGSKSGALHAIRSMPEDINNPLNGTEAWAFIGQKIARGMSADIADPSQAVHSYSDGSPTIADVILDDGELHTVALITAGNGGRSVYALDITNTINSETGAVIGPTPLWQIIPDGAFAGLTLSKPAIGRVKVAGVPRFFAIIASGFAPEDPLPPYSKGRGVVAVDIATGEIMWRFQSACPVTSDITLFETRDIDEPGDPTLDGFIDRALWADSCGNIYKVDLAQDLAGQYISSIGDRPTGSSDPLGVAINSLFSTSNSPCSLSDSRPISGTIGVRPDGTGRTTIFFGTGGLESFNPTLENHFYAIYADTGEIRGCSAGEPERGRIVGSCVIGQNCEKFYGGVVVTSTDVLVTSATDPIVGSTTCDFGDSKVTGLAITSFQETFNVATNSATVSALYGAGEAIYFTTLSGNVVRIGTPRSEQAGGDSSSGQGGGQSEDEEGEGGGGEGINIIGWRRLQ